MTSEAIKQDLVFQNFLMKEKPKVTNNLRSKIFPSTTLEDYEILSILGRGSFGLVVTAENKTNKKLFALKIIQKKRLAREGQMMHLISEIRILRSVKFEFLISLECYFTNKCFVFIVLPLVSGGNFFKLLRKVKRFDENTARFFAGQIVLAIEYLHYMGIVYRDLKPENLLLDLQGYLKVTDYGFAKRVGQSYAYTFCGTPEYLAPEILLSKGYRLSPDWWTLGVLLYEMCNGTPPFTSKNQLVLYEKILVGNIKWPEHFSYELKSIVQGLLQVDKNKRLGCLKKKAQDVKFHKWFTSLDWLALWHKKIVSPVKHFIHLAETNRKSTNVHSISFTSCTNFISSEMMRNIDFAI